MTNDLNDRAQAILRYVVDTYMETGEPVGSRTISRHLEMVLSPATIRNVMSDLEASGLLYARHTSAGRLPTPQGLRLYVDGLMEIGNITSEDRHAIEAQCNTAGSSMNAVFERATSMLSGLSSAASLIIAPKTNKPMRHMQFVRLDGGKILTVMVLQDNTVENRVMEVPPEVNDIALATASNYINAHISGKTLAEAERDIRRDMTENKAQLDKVTADLVQRGLSMSPLNDNTNGNIIIRGQSRLLEDVKAIEDLERARQLLASLEEQETMMRLLGAAEKADGVQIYIGTENPMFGHSGWSMVISPYKTPENRIIGAIGVIGPNRLNYKRIVPLVDYTSRVMTRILEG
jgi:heat-inducible transcriptional repressor